MTHVDKIPETQLVPEAQQLMSLCHQVKAVRSLRRSAGESESDAGNMSFNFNMEDTAGKTHSEVHYQPTVVAAFLVDPGSELKSCKIELRHRESFNVALRLNPNTTFSLRLSYDVLLPN